MRKFIALLILAVGIGGGVLFTIVSKGDWVLGCVAVGVGLLFSVPIAAAVAGVGVQRGRRGAGSGWFDGSGGVSNGGLFKGDSPIKRWDR